MLTRTICTGSPLPNMDLATQADPSQSSRLTPACCRSLANKDGPISLACGFGNTRRTEPRTRN